MFISTGFTQENECLPPVCKQKHMFKSGAPDNFEVLYCPLTMELYVLNF